MERLLKVASHRWCSDRKYIYGNSLPVSSTKEQIMVDFKGVRSENGSVVFASCLQVRLQIMWIFHLR